MIKKYLQLPVTLLLFLLISQSVAAAPRVAVSVAPIHSLVSSLMQGVTQPTLLFADSRDAIDSMDPVQQSQVLIADLVIWIGPGLEKSLAQMTDRFPSIEQKLSTLSNTVPLLRSRELGGITSSRQEAFEMTFWNDPRIAMIAVRQITPKLVRIDPDNTERYLDNEIRLLRRIKEAEQQISTMLSPVDSIPASIAGDIDPYFAHRFVAAANIRQTAPDPGLVKVSSQGPRSCQSSTKQTASSAKPGTELYFQALQAEAQRIHDCATSIHRSTANTKHSVPSPMEG